MKNHWIRRISIGLAAFLLLAVLPISSMAAKDAGYRNKIATPSNAPRIEGTIEEESIVGIWEADEVTSYRFEEDGTGAMVLPAKEYSFKYQTDGNELTLKFDSSRIGKKIFSFTIDRDELKLKLLGKEDFAAVTLERVGD